MFPETTDRWMLESGPNCDVVVSSRARLARNLPRFPFSPRAKREQLSAIAQTIADGLQSSKYFGGFRRFEVSGLNSLDRRFLRESHLISADLEKGRDFSEVYLDEDARISIMVNEEDHLRLQTLMSGFRIREVYDRIEEIESELEQVVRMSYDPSLGYLTACPTNTGTGLRVSAMVHLVGLVLTHQAEAALGSLGDLGLVVRGSYGENSSHAGEMFQVSNEVTLGRHESNLIEVLTQVVQQLIDRETQAREMLFENPGARVEDKICRAIGLLKSARVIESTEAIEHLSYLRLAIGRNFGLTLTHERLNRLVVDVQPAHLRYMDPSTSNSEEGDIARAAYLRRMLNGGAEENN